MASLGYPWSPPHSRYSRIKKLKELMFSFFKHGFFTQLKKNQSFHPHAKRKRKLAKFCCISKEKFPKSKKFFGNVKSCMKNLSKKKALHAPMSEWLWRQTRNLLRETAHRFKSCSVRNFLVLRFIFLSRSSNLVILQFFPISLLFF